MVERTLLRMIPPMMVTGSLVDGIEACGVLVERKVI